MIYNGDDLTTSQVGTGEHLNSEMWSWLLHTILITSTHAGVKEERNVAGKFCYISNMVKLVTSTHAGVKEENNGVGKYCYMSNMEKLVTSTHAGVKEENNVAGKFCYMSNMEKTGHQYSCWC